MTTNHSSKVKDEDHMEKVLRRDNNITNDTNGESSEEITKAVEGTAEQILNGQKNTIFVMTEKTCFDQDMMSEAMSTLSEYLIPKPTEEDKKSSGLSKFSIDEKKIEEFLQNYVLNESVISLEFMLLVVKVITQSSDKVLKAVFKIKKLDNSAVYAGTVIFTYWLSYVFSVMEKRRHRFSRSKPKLGEKRTEELVASAIFDLITNFKVIKTQKQITLLKNKYFVDWVHSVQKTYEYVNVHHISDVLASCKVTTNRLDEMLGDAGPTNQYNTPKTFQSEEKKIETKSSKSTEDTSKLRLAKMIEESKKRNRLQQEKIVLKEEKVSQPDLVKKETGKKALETPTSNDINTVSNKGSNSSSSFVSTNSTTKIKEEKKIDKVHSSTFEDDSERISCKSENGLLGLPFGSSWKTSALSDESEYNSSKKKKPFAFDKTELNPKISLPSSNIQRNNMMQKQLQDNDERLTNKGVDGLSGLPLVGNWKQNNFQPTSSSKRSVGYEMMDGGGDEKRRKIGDTYFVPPTKVDTGELHPSHQNQRFTPPTKKNVEEIRPTRPPLKFIPPSKVSTVTSQSARQFQTQVTNKDLSDIVREASMGQSQQERKKNASDNSVRSSNSQNFHSSDVSGRNSVSSKNEQTFQTHTFPSQVGNSIGGRGRGRGKDINKPAWMTQQERTSTPSTGSMASHREQNNVPKSLPPSAPPPQMGRGRGRGRGRGKDINKPAWMTQQDNTNIMDSSSMESRNEQRKVAPPPQLETGGGRGRGRGRGRGKDMHKPAWMTQQERTSTLNTGSMACHREQNNIPRSAPPSVPPSVPSPQMGRGRGRGKDINKPAWMTQQDNTNIMDSTSMASRSDQSNVPRSAPPPQVETGGGRGRGKDMHKPAWVTQQDNASTPNTDSMASHREQNNVPRSAPPSAPPLQMGRGRGRGKDINKPAWMTQHDNSNIIDSSSMTSRSELSNVPRSVPPPQSETGGGRGRGRGKDMNKPAWMTKQERSNDASAPSLPQEHTERNSHRGGGVGRGKDINTPSWLPNNKASSRDPYSGNSGHKSFSRAPPSNRHHNSYHDSNHRRRW